MANEKKNVGTDEADVITLQFEGGEDVECEIMGVFDYNGKEYIALIPLDGTMMFTSTAIRKSAKMSLKFLKSRTTRNLKRLLGSLTRLWKSKCSLKSPVALLASVSCGAHVLQYAPRLSTLPPSHRRFFLRIW